MYQATSQLYRDVLIGFLGLQLPLTIARHVRMVTVIDEIRRVLYVLKTVTHYIRGGEKFQASIKSSRTF